MTAPVFIPYAVGLCMASVCTSLPDDETTARLNAEHPTGITSQWQIANELFQDGSPNGRPCDQRPATHRHLLFEC